MNHDGFDEDSSTEQVNHDGATIERASHEGFKELTRAEPEIMVVSLQARLASMWFAPSLVGLSHSIAGYDEDASRKWQCKRDPPKER